MPRRCSICAHPETAELSKALARGDSVRSVASRFKVTPAASQRHLVNCLLTVRRAEKRRGDAERTISADSSRFDTDEGEISTPADLLERLRTLFRLHDLLEEAITRKDIDGATKLARELRAGLGVLRADRRLACRGQRKYDTDRRAEAIDRAPRQADRGRTQGVGGRRGTASERYR